MRWDCLQWAQRALFEVIGKVLIWVVTRVYTPNKERWARETCIFLYVKKCRGKKKGKTHAQAKRKPCFPGGQLGTGKGGSTLPSPFLQSVGAKEVRAAAAEHSPEARTRGGRGPSCFGRALWRAGRRRGRNWGGAGRSAAKGGGGLRAPGCGRPWNMTAGRQAEGADLDPASTRLPSRLPKLLSALFYGTCSFLIVLVNKALLTTYR